MTDVTIPNRDGLEYTRNVDGEVSRDHPSIRCLCKACFAERSQARMLALLDLQLQASMYRDSCWAFASWDGPLARFPGHVSDDLTTNVGVHAQERRHWHTIDA